MQGDDEIVAIVKLLQRQATLLNLISLQLGDQACMLIPTLEVCGRCDRDPITVEHRLMGLQTCDRCAAELIVK